MLRGRCQTQEGEITVIFFYEELSVRTIREVCSAGIIQECLNADYCKIVPKVSATLNRYTSISIHANHMDMTKSLSDQDPDYRNVLSELQRFIEPGPHQPRKALRLVPSESSGTGGEYHCKVRNQGHSAGEQVQTTVHDEAISKQPTKLVNTFSGNFKSGGGKMIQGGQFNSGGGPISF